MNKPLVKSHPPKRADPRVDITALLRQQLEASTAHEKLLRYNHYDRLSSFANAMYQTTISSTLVSNAYARQNVQLGIEKAIEELVDRFRRGAVDTAVAHRLSDLESQVARLEATLSDVKSTLHAALKADADFEQELSSLGAESDDDSTDDFDYAQLYADIGLARD